MNKRYEVWDISCSDDRYDSQISEESLSFVEAIKTFCELVYYYKKGDADFFDERKFMLNRAKFKGMEKGETVSEVFNKLDESLSKRVELYLSEECQEVLDDEFPIMEWTSFYDYDSNSVREKELKISSVEELMERYPNHTKKLTNNNIKQAKKFFNKLA